MRIDLRTRPLDPRWNQYGAYLDGMLLRFCLMADEEAGEAITHIEIDGTVVCDQGTGAPVEIVHRGHVELRPTAHT